MYEGGMGRNGPPRMAWFQTGCFAEYSVLHSDGEDILHKTAYPYCEEKKMERLKEIATKKVVAVAERASKKAIFRDNMHNFWSAVFHCYLNIEQRYESLSYLFPGVKKVIHCSEVMHGDILVSDFHSGMNLGFLHGGLSPVKIRVLESDGDLITGEVLGVGIGDFPNMHLLGKIGDFKNEVWYFISHRFSVIEGFKDRPPKPVD